MFSKINSFRVHGVEGFPVAVEADVSDGLPGFIMVGFLPKRSGEAQERVRTALKMRGFICRRKGDGKSVARGYKEGRDGL